MLLDLYITIILFALQLHIDKAFKNDGDRVIEKSNKVILTMIKKKLNQLQ